MKYRHKFLEKVRKELGCCEELERLIDEGSPFLGDYIEKRAVFRMSAEDILTCFTLKQENKIKAEAEKVLRLKELHHEWEKQYMRAVQAGKEHDVYWLTHKQLAS